MKKTILFGRLPKSTTGKISGPEKVALNLFENLYNIDKDIKFLNLNGNLEIEDKLYNKKNGFLFKIFPISIKDIIPYLIKNKPDIVHIVNYTGRSILPILLVKPLIKFKLYYTCHGCIKYEMKYSDGLKKRDLYIEKLIFNNADKIFPVSQKSKNLVCELYPNIDSNKVFPISNGMDIINKFNKVDISKKLNLSENRKILFTVGLRKIKNIETIIELYKAMNDKSYILVIAGDSPDEYSNYIKEKYKDLLKSKDIIFTGYLDQDELFSIYKESYAYIQLSHFETFGLSIVESLSQGTPVIINKNIGVEDILNKDREDILVIEENINDFRLALKKVATLNKDNICKVINFSWNEMAKNYNSQYNIDELHII